MKTVTTLNSVYEVDEQAKRIRRLSGTVTKSIPEDGVWNDFDHYQEVESGFFVVQRDDGWGIVSSPIRLIDEGV